MNEWCMEKLVEQIDTIFKKELVFEPLNKEKGFNEGFMIFSKEEYPPEKVEELNLGKYPYKKRYYYVEKLNKNSKKNVVFVLFNCSTSNPDKLDPTVENCKILAQKERYNYSRIEVLNLFSVRKPKVCDIDKDDLTNDKDNLNFIQQIIKERAKENCDIIFAWGYGKERKYTENARKEKNKLIFKGIDKIRKLKENNLYNIKKLTIDLKGYEKLAYHPGKQAWSKIKGENIFENHAIIIPYDEK